MIRQQVIFRFVLSLHSFLILDAGFTVVHADLTNDAVPEGAHLAGEDVAILFGGKEAAPGAGRRGTGPKLFVTLTAVLGGFVEPPR